MKILFHVAISSFAFAVSRSTRTWCCPSCHDHRTSSVVSAPAASACVTRPVYNGRVTQALAAGAETTVEVRWSWQEGQHQVRVDLDTANANDEIATWNNIFIDITQA